jgi:hypothetical protein
MGKKVVSTTSDMIEALPLYERSSKRERDPENKKWRGIQVNKIEWADNDHMRFRPVDENIKWEHIVYSGSEEAKNVPQKMNRDGGWILFNGIYVTSYWANDDFSSKFREVACEHMQILKSVPCHKITKVHFPEGSQMVHVETDCSFDDRDDQEDAVWLIPPQIFQALNPRVGDRLVFDLNKQYSVIPAEEVIEEGVEVAPRSSTSLNEDERERLAFVLQEYLDKKNATNPKHNGNKKPYVKPQGQR